MIHQAACKSECAEVDLYGKEHEMHGRHYIWKLAKLASERGSAGKDTDVMDRVKSLLRLLFSARECVHPYISIAL
jgi:hypothetical protein